MLLCFVKYFLVLLGSVYASKPFKIRWCQVDVIMTSFLKNGVVKPIFGVAPPVSAYDSCSGANGFAVAFCVFARSPDKRGNE